MRTPHPGLCAGCRHHRIVRSGRGSTFHLCELSKVEPAFPRYPPLPVIRCRGFEPASRPDPIDTTNEEGGNP